MRERISTDNIPQAKGKLKVLHEDGDTEDIIKVVLDADKFKSKEFCQFAEQFAGKDGLKKLWRFVRFNIKYKEDPFGHQYIQLPPALWKSGVGDCKSKTLFINAVLRCLGISYKTRFVSYGSTKVTHVYTVAIIDGQELPIDAVYTKFGQEAPYSYKRDYMTKIAVVSGPPMTANTKKVKQPVKAVKGRFTALKSVYGREADAIIKESKEKQSYLKPAEMIPFSRLTEGEAKARILLRQLQIKAVMLPEKAKVFDEMIAVTERLIHNGGKGFTQGNALTGSIPKGMESYAKFLQSAMRDQRPAVNLNRKGNAKAARVGNAPYGNPIPAYNTYFDQDEYFYFGKNSKYKKKWGDVAYNSQYTIGAWFTQTINDMKRELMKNAQGGNINNTFFGNALSPFNALGPLFTKMVGTKPPVLNNWNIWVPNNSGGITTPNTAYTVAEIKAATTAPVQLGFYDPSMQKEFEDRIKTNSGILDEYVHDMFLEQNGVGVGVLYGYATNVVIGGQQLGLNSYPQAVANKSPWHSAWMNSIADFSGISVGNIKNMGANTVIANIDGKDPTEILETFLRDYNPNLSGYNQDQVGEIFTAIVLAIIGLISAIITAATGSTANAKNEALIMDPTGGSIPDNWTPIGPGLEFVDADWETNPAATPGASKSNSTNLLALGAAGLGLYFLTQNDK